MSPGGGRRAAGRFAVLRALVAALGEAATPDQVARSALSCATQVDGVVRAGMAVTEGGGRQLRFTARERDAAPADVSWCQIDGLADVPLAQTVRTGDGVFVGSLDDLARRFPGLVEHQRGFGVQSLAALPLPAGAEPLGGLLLTFDAPHAFDDPERAFLEAFAAQVGQAWQQATSQPSEPDPAGRLQRSLMPESLPDLDGLLLGAHYHPGALGTEVGGDWYDVFPLADGSVLVALGDVMGKGSSAAVVMGQVRAATRAYALLDPTPTTMLARLDMLVRSLSPPEQIVTMACGLVAADRGALTLALAGHPPPLTVPPTGRTSVLAWPAGPPLGLGAGDWVARTLELEVDLTVLLYSNGLVQTRQVDFVTGLDRMRTDLEHTDARHRGPRGVCAKLGGLAWDRAAEDDVTLLALSRTSRRRLHSDRRELPSDASASPLARHFLRDRLHEWGVDEEVADTAQLCVSELVTNAVIHAGTPSRLDVRLDDQRLLVSVTDRGVGAAVRRGTEDVTESTGRGLTIVDVLASAWSAERDVDGTTVWFELDVAAPVSVP